MKNFWILLIIVGMIIGVAGCQKDQKSTESDEYGYSRDTDEIPDRNWDE